MVEERKENARKQQENLEQMKLRFFTNISHEFRTPLTLILTPLGSLIRQQGDNELKQKLTVIYRNAEKLLDTYCKEYEQAYYFAQGTGDIQYLKDLGYAHKVTLLSPQLPCYNEILSQGNIDYIGTRLHAGIRALQNSVRSFIIGIDNRAIEMANDFCLPVLNQHNLSELTTLINKDYSLDLTIPFENINQWRAQFTSK